MANILLINPSFLPAYGGTKTSVTSPYFPALGLAAVAAVVRERGHRVRILDLSYRPYDHRLIRQTIIETQADVVGITGTTPLMNQIRDRVNAEMKDRGVAIVDIRIVRADLTEQLRDSTVSRMVTERREGAQRAVLSNSFGFGGQNVSLVVTAAP